MSSNANLSENIDASPSARSPRRLGMAVWLLIFGLVVLNIGVLVETIDWNQRTIAWLLYRINPRYWPLWLIPILWGIVAWQTINFAHRKIKFDQSAKWLLRVLVLVGVLAFNHQWFSWTGKYFKAFYYGFYSYFFLEPLSLLYSDGQGSLRLLSIPVVAAVTVGLYVMFVKRRSREDGK